MNPLLIKTRVVSAARSASFGIGMILTEPIVLDFGEPRLSGGVLLFGPAPWPRAFETYNVLPSALTFTDDGHHAVGMCPITLPLRPFKRTTPTALIPGSATYKE